ncbi:LysR substrate-binding domain-containing protein [Roseivivax sp. CAU 1761]
MSRIKNIKSLQVFETVARLRSVTVAAQVLNVSQSSVSYHIKKLEDEIGAPLFERRPDGLVATPRGTVLASHVERGLATLQAGLERVSEQAEVVRVAVLPMFASRWLSSRLGSFWEANPSLQLTFQNHNNSYVDLGRPTEFADLGVQWGRGTWPGFDAIRLWCERMVIVCSADYRARHDLRTLADVRRCTLLHVDDDQMWAEWFSNAQLEMSSTQRQMTLEDRHFQLSSTVNGLGVSLFARSMIQSELMSGAVVNPFERSFATSFAYYLAIPSNAVLSPSASLFKTWLLDLCQSLE